MRPPLPVTKVKHEIISNISIPIVYKTSAKDFQIEIENIISTDIPNKKRLINQIMMKLNKSLLLSIDNYVNFNRKDNDGDDKVDMSYDSQLTNNFEEGRVHNATNILEKWKDNNPQFTLKNSNLALIYSIVNSYAENQYIRYIINSNTSVAFSMIGEEQKSEGILDGLDSTLLNQTGRNPSISHSKMYQSLCQSVRYFNLGVYYMRKVKTESILNQIYEESGVNELEQLEPYK